MTITYSAATPLGTVAHNGTNIQLTGQAEAANQGTDGGVVYRAHGVDASGNNYLVTWQPTGDGSDEETACDWDDYTVLPL